MVYSCRALIMFLVLFVLSAPTANAERLLPDLWLWAEPSTNFFHSPYIYGWEVDTDSEPGRTLIRTDTATTNIGAGPLELRAEDIGGGEHNVYQRILESSTGLFEERLIGTFPESPDGFHVQIDQSLAFRLREVVSGNGVGAVLAEDFKTVFGLIDSVAFDTSLPGAPIPPDYTTITLERQGISVGYADIYPNYFDSQYVDVTGIPYGTYWLEVEVDPVDRLLELDETNNVTRILIQYIAVPEPASVYLALAALLYVIGLAAFGRQ